MEHQFIIITLWWNCYYFSVLYLAKKSPALITFLCAMICEDIRDYFRARFVRFASTHPTNFLHSYGKFKFILQGILVCWTERIASFFSKALRAKQCGYFLGSNLEEFKLELKRKEKSNVVNMLLMYIAFLVIIVPTIQISLLKIWHFLTRWFIYLKTLLFYRNLITDHKIVWCFFISGFCLRKSTDTLKL